MRIQYLPAELGAAGHDAAQVVDYRVQAPCRNNRIQLTQHVFSFLLEGTKEMTTPSHAVRIDSHQFLLIRAGNCLMTERLSSGNTYHSLLFFFSEDLVERLAQRQAHLVRPASPTLPGFVVLPYDEYISHFVHGLRLWHQQGQPAQQSRLLHAKLEEIMLYLLEREGPGLLSTLLGGPRPTSPQQVLRQVVERNALNPLGVAELAFLCNMSVSTFQRHFQREFQTSPRRWFQQQRLQHSAYLLTTQQQRPTDIYAAIGFENLSSFTQAFKQKFGLTPKQFQSASRLTV